MESKALKLLLIEDDLADANWIGKILREQNRQKFQVWHVQKVATALHRLSQDDFDAMLLNLSLSNSEELNSLEAVYQKAPQLPIVVLTAKDDPTVAVQSLRKGAQDYLIKGEFDGKSLKRSIA